MVNIMTSKTSEGSPSTRQQKVQSTASESSEVSQRNPPSIDNKYDEPFAYDENFKGPVTKRYMTNRIFLIVYIFYIIIWFFIGCYGFAQGHISRLVTPMDSEGLICGKDNTVKDKPYLFFFDVLQCGWSTLQNQYCDVPMLCVQKCPNVSFFGPVHMKKNFFETRDLLICKYNFDKRTINTEHDMKRAWDTKKCAIWYLESEMTLSRCMPRHDLNLNEEDFKEVNIDLEDLKEAVRIIKSLINVMQILQILVAGVIKTWPFLLGAYLITIIVCILYLILLHLYTKIFVWFSYGFCLSFFLFCFFVSAHQVMQLKYDERGQQPDTTSSGKISYIIYTIWMVIASLFTALFALTLPLMALAAYLLFQRINVTIKLIQEATKAALNMKSALLFPILPALAQLILFTWMLVVELHLTTLGAPIYTVTGLKDSSCECDNGYQDEDPCTVDEFLKSCQDEDKECETAKCHFSNYTTSPMFILLHIWNIFGLIWSLTLITGFNNVTLAGTFATWYWTLDKEKLKYNIVTTTALRALIYHMGTAALGSLLLIGKFFFFCSCLSERCRKSTNCNGYIVCAIHNTDFHTSSRIVYNLKKRNSYRIGILLRDSQFILVLGQLCTTGIMMMTHFWIFSAMTETAQLYYFLLPVLLVGIGSYYIATVIFEAFGVAAHTFLICILEDFERNDGSLERPYYMPIEMNNYLYNERHRIVHGWSDPPSETNSANSSSR